MLVGRDAPSAVYLQQILRTCKSVGIDGRLVEIPGRASAARLRNAIVALNEDPLVVEAFDRGIQAIMIGEKTPQQVAAEVQKLKARQMGKKTGK